jgi:hypothetical protein
MYGQLTIPSRVGVGNVCTVRMRANCEVRDGDTRVGRGGGWYLMIKESFRCCWRGKKKRRAYEE